MRLGYFIPTYNQIDWVLDKHLPSLDASLFEYVHVHHNYLVDTSSVSRVDSFKLRAPLLFTHTSQNLGVAATWNLFCNFAIEQGIDVAFIANDDIILNDQTLPRMCDKLRETRLDGIVCYGGDNEFSLFAIPLRVYNIIGKFDENFFPAYFEDNDYRFRMKLHKIPVYLLESPGYFHRGSSTINAFNEDDMRQHHENFRKNERYYINKWGGPPGKETVPTS